MVPKHDEGEHRPIKLRIECVRIRFSGLDLACLTNQLKILHGNVSGRGKFEAAGWIRIHEVEGDRYQGWFLFEFRNRANGCKDFILQGVKAGIAESVEQSIRISLRTE